MMYARMPELDPVERLARLPAIDPSSVRIAPVPAGDAEVTRFAIGTLEGRPVYRLTAKGKTQLSFADTGEAIPVIDAAHALRIARAFDGGGHGLHYDER